ncbi:MAG: hypothetical protein CBARDCOR_2960 [uncultured Caballeronia sp.]|nr:MAG: hypothetical protein CBARDCOR_2960 [uncultured Caballeronia sp.]
MVYRTGIIRTRACAATPNRFGVTVDFKRRDARCRRLRSFFTISRHEIVRDGRRADSQMTWLRLIHEKPMGVGVETADPPGTL